MAGAAIPLSGAQAVSIINGSFEDGTDPGSSFTTLYTGSTDITGWVVGGASVDYISGYWTPSQGRRSVDVNGYDTGSISQTLTGLTVGNTYKITFDLAGNPDSGPTIKTLQVTASVDSNNYTFDISGKDRVNMGWTPELFSFVANASTALLSFSSTVTSGGGFGYPAAFGPALDNVAILDNSNAAAATPLPASWSMMLIGFAAFGGLGVYRRRRLATARA